MSVPSQIGNYRLEREIGRGASSEVWLGRHVDLPDHVVAVKILMSQERETVRRFQREAAIAARLRHANIARLYDYGRIEPFFYTLMEYIEGASLRQVLTKRGRIPFEEACAIFGQVAVALDYAHSLNVVHRDISPANILLEERSGRTLLTDFGIARETSQPITGDRLIMGTPGYLSPEHALSATSVTHLSDVFCLGIVLYQMLSGELPWPERPGLAALPSFDELIPLRERGVRDVPPDVDRVLATLLAPEPTRRYPSAGAAAEELRRILQRHQGATQVLSAAPALERAVEIQTSGIEPNQVEAVLGPDLKQAVIARAHSRAEELRSPAAVAALLDEWAAQDRLRRRPLLGRLARLHKIGSRNLYFYTLRVLYERRGPPELDEEPDRKPHVFPLEPEIERWAVPLPAPAGFADEPGGRQRLPGSTRVVTCKPCQGQGRTICPRCEGKQRIYVPRPAAAPRPSVGAAEAAGAAVAPVSAGSTASAAAPRPEQVLAPCPECEGTGSFTCQRCAGTGRLVQRRMFSWSRTAQTLSAHDELPALTETWLVRSCQPEVVYAERQQGGMRPEWSLIAPVAELIRQAEARCDDETRIAMAELEVGLVPVTDIVFDLGKPGEDGLYKLAIYGFERRIPPDWRFFNWERVVALCLIAFLSLLVLILLVFAFLG